MKENQNDIAILVSEIKKSKTDAPSPSDMIHLDNNLVSWVRQTYRQYGVNLFAFASDLAYSTLNDTLNMSVVIMEKGSIG
jgi:hypothetical protein